MSRKGLTAVEQEKLVAVANKLGLNVVTRKGFTKVFAPGATRGAALGIPNTKLVTRVELVGFTSEAGIPHPKPPAKTVEQMLNFGQEEASILGDFYKAAKKLLELPPPPAKEEKAEPAEAPAAAPAPAAG